MTNKTKRLTNHLVSSQGGARSSCRRCRRITSLGRVFLSLARFGLLLLGVTDSHTRVKDTRKEQEPLDSLEKFAAFQRAVPAMILEYEISSLGDTEGHQDMLVDWEQGLFLCLGLLVWAFIIHTVLSSYRTRRALQQMVDDMPDLPPATENGEKDKTE